MAICLVSSVRGGYDLAQGAPFGIEMATLGLVWAFAYGWLSGRWLPTRLRSSGLIAPDDGTAQPLRGARRRDTPLESVLSWGMWAFFLALVLWLASGA
jgi:hypothetical protein